MNTLLRSDSFCLFVRELKVLLREPLSQLAARGFILFSFQFNLNSRTLIGGHASTGSRVTKLGRRAKAKHAIHHEALWTNGPRIRAGRLATRLLAMNDLLVGAALNSRGERKDEVIEFALHWGAAHLVVVQQTKGCYCACTELGMRIFFFSLIWYRCTG